jgi:hypothetical protein
MTAAHEKLSTGAVTFKDPVPEVAPMPLFSQATVVPGNPNPAPLDTLAMPVSKS